MKPEYGTNSIIKKFYNPEQKKAYLDTRPNNKALKDITSLFRRIGSMMEAPLNKDISEMDQQEFLGMFVSLQIYDYTSIRKNLSLIRDYIDWTISNGLSNSQINVSRLISAEDISIEKNLELACVKDELDLKDKVYTVYEFGNCYTQPPLMFLIWMGIPLKEALLLKNEDVDALNGIVHYNNKDLIIPKPFLETFRDYKNTDIGTREGNNTQYPVYLGKSDYFLKKIYRDETVLENAMNEPINYTTIISIISKFKKIYFDITGKMTLLNSNSIFLSGNLYRIYQLEQGGQVISEDMFINRNISKIKKTDRDILLNDKKLQYEVYKKVFWS